RRVDLSAIAGLMQVSTGALHGVESIEEYSRRNRRRPAPQVGDVRLAAVFDQRTHPLAATSRRRKPARFVREFGERQKAFEDLPCIEDERVILVRISPGAIVV